MRGVRHEGESAGRPDGGAANLASRVRPQGLDRQEVRIRLARTALLASWRACSSWPISCSTGQPMQEKVDGVCTGAANPSCYPATPGDDLGDLVFGIVQNEGQYIYCGN